MVGDVLHDLFHLFLDNLGPMVLALCLILGIGLGAWGWLRGRSRKEMVQQVAVYAEALKDVTSALQTSNTTVAATQTALTEANQQIIGLSNTLNEVRGELKRTNEANTRLEQRLTMSEQANAQLKALLEAERLANAQALADMKREFATMQAEVERLKALLKVSEDARLRIEREARDQQALASAREKELQRQIDDLRTELLALRQVSRPVNLLDGPPVEPEVPGSTTEPGESNQDTAAHAAEGMQG